MKSAPDEQQSLRAARDLIRAQRYDEARALLRPLRHPTALEWLARLDQIAPVAAAPATRGSVAAGMVTALLVLALSTGIFLFFRQMPDTVVIAAEAPADGCGAPRWWARVNTLFARVEYNALPDDESDAVDTQAQLALWQGIQSGLEALDTPACVESARAELLAGVRGEIAAYQAYDPAAPEAQMRQVYEAMLHDQSAALALQAADVRFDDSTRFSRSLRMLASDCPAQLWLLETLYVKNDFFRLLESAQSVIYASDPAAAAQNYILDLSRETLTLKYAANPPCVGAAKSHLMKAMEAYVSVIQAYQGRANNGINVHLQTMQTELVAFEDEMNGLGVSLDIGV